MKVLRIICIVSCAIWTLLLVLMNPSYLTISEFVFIVSIVFELYYHIFGKGKNTLEAKISFGARIFSEVIFLLVAMSGDSRYSFLFFEFLINIVYLYFVCFNVDPFVSFKKKAILKKIQELDNMLKLNVISKEVYEEKKNTYKAQLEELLKKETPTPSTKN